MKNLIYTKRFIIDQSYGYDNQTINWREAYESGTKSWLFYYDKDT